MSAPELPDLDDAVANGGAREQARAGRAGASESRPEGAMSSGEAGERLRTTHHTDGDLLERADSSLLELVDHLLDKGAVIDAELVLGLADVDLVYVRLSALICAADRVLPARPRGEASG